MARLVFLMALAACNQPAPQATGSIMESLDVANQACSSFGCSNSAACNDIFSRCRYCYQGHCSAVLPADPLDAGTDAAPGGTTMKGTAP